MLPALGRARGAPLGPAGAPAGGQGLGGTTIGPESTIANVGAEKARIELGLKQAFQTADGDNSGNISVTELLDVIKRTGAAKGPSRGRPPPFGSKMVGLEDTTALLLSLAGEGGGSSSSAGPAGGTYSDAWLDMTVRKVFSRLDVDGDGCISWWEWQAVLGGSLLGRSAGEKYLDPMDSLAIIVQVMTIGITHPVYSTNCLRIQITYPVY